MVAACKQLLDRFKDAGAVVVEVEVPELALMRVVHMVTIVSEMAAAHLQHMAAHKKEYAHDTRLNLNLASRLTAADYVHAQRLRVRLCRYFYEFLERVDAIVTPTAGRTAPRIPKKALKTGESNLTLLEQIMRFAPAANLTGLPAVSMPAGYSEEGLPIGFQVLGRSWEEHKLLRLAAVAETVVSRREPQVNFRLLG